MINNNREDVVGVFALSLATLIVALWASRILFGTYQTPLALFALVWLGFYCLLQLKLVNYFPLSNEVNVMIFGAFFIFLLGTLIFRISLRPRTRGALQTEMSWSPNLDTYTMVYYKLFLLLSYVGFILWVLEAIKIVGIGPLLHMKPYVLRATISGTFGRTGQYLMSASLGCCNLAGIYMARGQKFKWIYLFGFIPGTSLGILTGQRIDGIWGFLLFVIPIILIKSRKIKSGKFTVSKRSRWRTIAVSVIIFVAFVVGAATRRGSLTNIIGSTQITNPALEKFYIYITGPYVALSEQLRVWNGEINWGIASLTPLYKITNSLGISHVDKSFILSLSTGRAFIPIPFPFNVFTFLWDLIYDFGVIGMVTICFILGFVSALTWWRSNVKMEYGLSNVLLSFVSLYLLMGVFDSVSTFNQVWIGFFVSAFSVQRIARKARSWREEIPHEGFGTYKIAGN